MALAEKLNQVDKLKLELDALLPMSVENETRWWKKVRLDWNYNSNHIEGNTLTYGETQLLDRKSTRLNSSHIQKSRMPSSA